MIVIQLVTLKKVLLYHIILHYPGGIIWWSWPFTGLSSSHSLSMWKGRWLRISWNMWQCIDWNCFKDFWEMFVHHVATIALMVLSWTCHLHRCPKFEISIFSRRVVPWTTSNITTTWLLICWRRVGSLVLLVHDFADHWLELAKMARYVRYQVWYLLHMWRLFA